MDPHPNSALPPRIFMSTLALKLFRRTSYLQVRLEFLRYPQVIQALFNVPWFGPPVRPTAPSTCSWVGHMVSGLRPDTNSPYSDSVSLRLRLQLNLASYRNSPVHSTKARSHPLTGSELVVGTRFQVLFHSPPGCFSPSLTVLVHYRSLGYLALGDGPPRFRRNFTCPPYSGYSRDKDYFKYRIITLFD